MAGKNKLIVKSEYIKKPHRVIQIEGKLNLVQHKCWNILALNALKKGIKERQRKYEISLTEIYKHLGYKAENDKHLKEALVSIMRIVIQGDIINKDGGLDWHAFVLLGHCYVEKGVCHYEYTTPVIDLLSNPKQYVKLLMKMQNRFSSAYSLKLYEFLKTKYIEKQGRGTTGEMPIQTFRDLMGIEDKSYKEFKELKKLVILLSIKEINHKTDLFVELELIKNRQKVVALKFQITENPNKKQNLQGLDLESLHDLDFGNETENQDQPNPLKTKLEKLSFGENQISKFLNEKDQDKVMDSVDYVLMRMEKGATIKDLTAYLKTILEMHREGGLDTSAVEDWRAKQSKIDQEKMDYERKQQEEEEEKEKEAKLGKIKKEKVVEYSQKNPKEVKKICEAILKDLESNKKFIFCQVEKFAKKKDISIVEAVKICMLTSFQVEAKIWNKIEEEN